MRLELLDQQGQAIANVFNDTLRLITVVPEGQDTLAQLVRGELSAADARGIVDPDYIPPPVVAPEAIPEADPIPEPETSSPSEAEPEASSPPEAKPETIIDVPPPLPSANEGEAVPIPVESM